jgi:hypothetical protein
MNLSNFEFLKTPNLGPRVNVAMNPVSPPTRCTTPEPAWSMKPSFYNHPSPQTHPEAIG